MSRTLRGSKGPGYDYWSRRHPSNGISGYGRFIKKFTHKYERRAGKKQIDECVERDREECNCG